MGMAGSPFGQQYGQGGAQQQMGVNAQQQLRNKAALANSLPPFPSDLKGANSLPPFPSDLKGASSMPNLVSSSNFVEKEKRKPAVSLHDDLNGGFWERSVSIWISSLVVSPP
jgi:hypothetical protein